MTNRQSNTAFHRQNSIIVLRWFTVIAGAFAILAFTFTLGVYFERFRSNSNYIAERFNKVQVESAVEQDYEQIHQSVLQLFNRDYASMIADYGEEFRNYECRGDYFYDYDYTGTPLAFGYRSIRPLADECPQTIKLYRIKEGETYYGISSDCLPSDVIDFHRTLIRYALNFYNAPILKSYSAFHALA